MKLWYLKSHFNPETFQHFLNGDPQHGELDGWTGCFFALHNSFQGLT